MFGKRQLKELSHICAYCGAALKEELSNLVNIKDYHDILKIF